MCFGRGPASESTVASEPLHERAHRDLVARRIGESADTLRRLAAPAHVETVVAAATMVAAVLRGGGKLLVFGNGGSAADAQHIAAELLGRFLLDRPALPAVALADNSAALTAIGNDYGFTEVFARQV